MENEFRPCYIKESSRSNIQFKSLHPSLNFNNVDAAQIRSQKQLGMSLDFKLNFNEHF